MLRNQQLPLLSQRSIKEKKDFYNEHYEKSIHQTVGRLNADNIHNPPHYQTQANGYQLFHEKKEFPLYYGEKLPELKVAYETWGKLNKDRSNTVLLFTGLSATSHAKSNDGNPEDGWWENFIAPGSAIDPEKYFIICMNHIGGCYGSIGPSSTDCKTNRPFGSRFPMLNVRDFVESQFRVLDHLGISKVHAVIGSSLGGMCSMMATKMYPDRINRAVTISACGKSHPSSIALRHLARQSIVTDNDWQNGDYYNTGRWPEKGMKLAREIASMTYRSGPEWEIRFGTKKTKSFDGTGPKMNELSFQIEQYLKYQGEKFCTKYDPNSLIIISKAMDLFSLSEDSTKSLDASCCEIKCPILVIGVNSDILFPVTQQRELADCLTASGNTFVTYYEVDSMYGHDTFLLDINCVGTAVKGFLDTKLEARRRRRRSSIHRQHNSNSNEQSE
ncbi:hypothetical protein SNEBB_002048 [Seison nebaliae]|nr:hypothetical protein SNEBB_002048 [Seison nebaliae]